MELDTGATTLKQFVDRVLRGRLALACPILEYPGCMYEEGEGLEADEVRALESLLLNQPSLLLAINR